MSRNNPLGTTLVFGGSVGSEGKGAIVGHLARKYRWHAAACTFMTNAGHTFIGNQGEKVVVQQLPMAVVAQEIPLLLIGAGAAITLAQLEKEINELDSVYDVSRRLRIHPRAMIIDGSDVLWEQHNSQNASTAKGCGSALARKVLRDKTVQLARDIPWLKEFMGDVTNILHEIIYEQNGQVLIEGSQGFDLDLNHGIEYPFCTSRGTTPMQVLADLGLAGSAVEETIAVLRTYPIRVGHVESAGTIAQNSGPFGGKEISWEEITRRSGSPEPLAEFTTVTKRLRRIFEMDFDRIDFMSRVCQPTSIALTFADYLDWSIHDQGDNTTTKDQIPVNVLSFAKKVEAYTGAPVTMLKTGAKDSALVTL